MGKEVPQHLNQLCCAESMLTAQGGKNAIQRPETSCVDLIKASLQVGGSSCLLAFFEGLQNVFGRLLQQLVIIHLATAC